MTYCEKGMIQLFLELLDVGLMQTQHSTCLFFSNKQSNNSNHNSNLLSSPLSTRSQKWIRKATFIISRRLSSAVLSKWLTCRDHSFLISVVLLKNKWWININVVGNRFEKKTAWTESKTKPKGKEKEKGRKSTNSAINQKKKKREHKNIPACYIIFNFNR